MSSEAAADSLTYVWGADGKLGTTTTDIAGLCAPTTIASGLIWNTSATSISLASTINLIEGMEVTIPIDCKMQKQKDGSFKCVKKLTASKPASFTICSMTGSLSGLTPTMVIYDDILPELKAGDKVVFTGGTKHRCRLTVGKTYEIERCHLREKNNKQWIWVTNDSGTKQGYSSGHFTLEGHIKEKEAANSFMEGLQNV